MTAQRKITYLKYLKQCPSVKSLGNLNKTKACYNYRRF